MTVIVISDQRSEYKVTEECVSTESKTEIQSSHEMRTTHTVIFLQRIVVHVADGKKTSIHVVMLLHTFVSGWRKTFIGY